MRIYLAHSGKKDIREKVKKIQNILVEYTNISCINPFDSGAVSKALTHLWDEHPENRNSELAKQIVSNDITSIEHCDILVAYIEEPSFGTAMEIYYAYRDGINVFIVTEYESPWLINHGHIVKNINELLEVLKLEN